MQNSALASFLSHLTDTFFTFFFFFFQLREVLAQHDATHNAILLHHEYVSVLERSVDQLHQDVVVATKNFTDLHQKLAVATKSFTGIVGSLMTHLSDYKGKAANSPEEAGVREELSALLRLHAQRLFAEAVTRDSVVADAAAAIAVAADRRYAFAARGHFPSIGYAGDAPTRIKRESAATASTTAGGAGVPGELDDSAIDWSADEEDSMGREIARVSDHLMRSVKRRYDRLDERSSRRSKSQAPPSAIEQAIALYADEPEGPLDELGQRARGKLPQRAVMILKRWIFENWYHPYPTEAQKRVLCEEAQLQLLQVNNWFTNARRRLLAKQAHGGHSRPVETEMIYDPAHEPVHGGLDRGSTSLLFASVGLPVPPFDVQVRQNNAEAANPGPRRQTPVSVTPAKPPPRALPKHALGAVPQLPQKRKPYTRKKVASSVAVTSTTTTAQTATTTTTTTVAADATPAPTTTTTMTTDVPPPQDFSVASTSDKAP
jgi:hypothetical protein